MTPQGLKADWLDILPLVNDVLASYRGDEWFTKLLVIARDWTDAELNKAVPRSPDLAISAVLDPLAKKDFFRPLIRAADSQTRKNIYRLRQELAALRNKARLVVWGFEPREEDIRIE